MTRAWLHPMLATAAALMMLADAAPVLATTQHPQEETLLEPGIYHLDSDAWRQVPVQPPVSGEVVKQRAEHAVPANAQVRYAFVSRDVERRLNKVVFLTASAYHYDINSDDTLCPAYAFPGWNFRSDAEPYCRTNIGDSDREARFEWGATRFSVSWNDRKRLLYTEKIPAQRKPTGEEYGSCVIGGSCPTEAFGTTISHYLQIHRRDDFVLEQRRAYMDALYLPNEASLHTESAADSPVRTLNAGSHVAVLERTPEWYRIESVATDGRIEQGWLNRDALATPVWKTQAAATAAFRFRVGMTPAEDVDGSVVPSVVEVLDAATMARVQVIRDFYADPVAADGDVLQLVDANFDGHPDIVLPGMNGGAGPNSVDNVFLFDPVSQRFVYDATLSSLPQLSIDPVAKTLTSSVRNSCCDHASETYRYRDGKLRLIESWSERLSPDGEYTLTTRGRLHNGRMKYSTVRHRGE